MREFKKGMCVGRVVDLSYYDGLHGMRRARAPRNSSVQCVRDIAASRHLCSGSPPCVVYARVCAEEV